MVSTGLLGATKTRLQLLRTPGLHPNFSCTKDALIMPADFGGWTPNPIDLAQRPHSRSGLREVNTVPIGNFIHCVRPGAMAPAAQWRARRRAAAGKCALAAHFV